MSIEVVSPSREAIAEAMRDAIDALGERLINQLGLVEVKAIALTVAIGPMAVTSGAHVGLLGVAAKVEPKTGALMAQSLVEWARGAAGTDPHVDRVTPLRVKDGA